MKTRAHKRRAPTEPTRHEKTALASDRRPGVRAPTLGRRWESPCLQQTRRARARRLDFLLRQQRHETPPCVAVGRQDTYQPLERARDLVRKRLAREIPDHRPQLVLDVETNAVIDRPDLARGDLADHVTALSIGVIDHDV